MRCHSEEELRISFGFLINEYFLGKPTNRAPLAKNVKLQLKPCEWLENKLEKCEGKQVEELQQQQENSM